MAAFFNEEEKADQIFKDVQTDYNALKGMAQQLATDSSTEWKGRQPKVAWIEKDWSNNFKFKNAQYKIDFIEDAGGQMVPLPANQPAGCTFGTNTDGAKTLTCPGASDTAMESFKAFLAQADLIIDESYVANHDATAFNFTATYPVTAEEIPALARDPPNIFRLDGMVSDNVGAAGQVGSSWFEQMPSQPQQLLAGVMEALWSSNFHSPCGFKFLRRVDGKEQNKLGHDDCPYHDAGGNHKCAGIHNHMHDIPKCYPEAEKEETVNSAIGVSFSTAVPVVVMFVLGPSA